MVILAWQKDILWQRGQSIIFLENKEALFNIADLLKKPVIIGEGEKINYYKIMDGQSIYVFKEEKNQ